MEKRYLTREELLSCQYAMLQEIHKTCTENGLTYYLAYGTLIGAVRHQGFIPWDDDVDIMMPVADYEKLRSIYKSDRFFITDCFHDKRHQLCFPRIYDGITCCDGNDNTLGVNIDIYLMHGAPLSAHDRAKHALKLIQLNSFKNTIAKWRGRFARHFFPFMWNQYYSRIVVFLCRWMYKTLNKYDYNTCDIVYAFGGNGFEFFWRACFNSSILLKFEEDYFCAPSGYHDILTARYGDYMKLPPEEDRHPYHGSSFYCWKSNL